MTRAGTSGGGRILWLVGALLASLLAAQWVSGEEGAADLEQPKMEQSQVEQRQEGMSPRKPTRAAGNEALNEKVREDELLRLDRLESRKFSAQAGDIFRAQSWAPPPPPRSEIEAEKNKPPPPPPLQFKYLGKIIEGEETQVFLTLAERNYVVKPGENINGQYRMDEVNDQAITITYLPLNVKQMLAIAGPGDPR